MANTDIFHTVERKPSDTKVGRDQFYLIQHLEFRIMGIGGQEHLAFTVVRKYKKFVDNFEKMSSTGC